MAAAWKEALGALLGISAYQKPPAVSGPSLDDASVERAREQLGGQLAPLPQTQTRWLRSRSRGCDPLRRRRRHLLGGEAVPIFPS